MNGKRGGVWRERQEETKTNKNRSHPPPTLPSGARVHSDSWGTDSSAYDDLAADFDRFAWLHPDFLPVVAAGNAGAAGGDGTVTSPAVAKNAVAVGATLTPTFTGSPEFESVTERRAGELLEVVVNPGSAPPPAGPRAPLRAVAASFGPPADALATVASLKLVVATDACTAPAGAAAAAWSGAAVLAWRGNCSFGAKAAAAATAGASALILANDGPGGPVRAAADIAPPASVPTLGVGRESGRALSAATAAPGGARVAVSRAPTPPSARFESLAYYSSSGPTLDGSIKPDITAPGTTVSAYSDG